MPVPPRRQVRNVLRCTHQCTGGQIRTVVFCVKISTLILGRVRSWLIEIEKIKNIYGICSKDVWCELWVVSNAKNRKMYQIVLILRANENMRLKNCVPPLQTTRTTWHLLVVSGN